MALLEGFVSGAIFGGAFGIIGSWAATYWQASLLLSAMTFMGGYFAFRDALNDFQEGHYLACIFDVAIGVLCAYSSARNANAASGLLANSPAKQQDPILSALKQLESSGVKPEQTQISRGRIMEIVNNYDSTKAQSSIYNDGTSLYIVDGHHTTVATKILGKGTGSNMGVPTQQMPSATNIHWYKHWYEFGKNQSRLLIRGRLF